MSQSNPDESALEREGPSDLAFGAITPSSNQDDAHVLLKLVELRDSPRLDDAFEWMRNEYAAKDFADFQVRYPRGSVGRRKFVIVCNFFELCGVLVKRGMLDEDLFFDIGFSLELVWSKVKHAMPGYREHTGPRMWENFEYLYRRWEHWEATHPPLLLQ